jgi:hypothetical protein
MNVYLAPLIDELTLLWVSGVPASDASAEPNSRHFQLRAILLWTLHEFPGYGVCSSLQTQGLKACPVCGPNQFTGRKLDSLKKVAYTGHRKFLPYGNTLRNHTNRRKFDGTNCDAVKPTRVTPQFWLQQWKKIRKVTRRGKGQVSTSAGAQKSRPGLINLKDSGMKRKSIFYKLPYYKVRKTKPFASTPSVFILSKFTVLL